MAKSYTSSLTRTFPVRIGILALLLAMPAFGSSTIIGLFSFDTITVGNPPDPGVNGFGISNLTGDPASLGFALPPDFPVYTFLTFNQVTLTSILGGVTSDIFLGDFGPGTHAPLAAQFSDSLSFDSATLTGTLSNTNLILWDGTHVVANSSQFVAVLLPSSGYFLAAGLDMVPISVETSAEGEVPEPGTMAMVLLSSISVWAYRRPRRK